MKNKLDKETEIQLVQEACAGSQKSFERLLGAGYERYIRSLAHQKIVGQADAEDVTMLSIERVWHNLPKLSSPHFFGTWTYRTTVNTCYDFLRRQRRQCATLVSFDSPEWGHFRENCPDPNQDTLDKVDADERREISLSALDKLDPIHREAIELIILKGLKYREAAKLVGKPTGTMQSRVSKGIKKLALELKK